MIDYKLNYLNPITWFLHLILLIVVLGVLFYELTRSFFEASKIAISSFKDIFTEDANNHFSDIRELYESIKVFKQTEKEEVRWWMKKFKIVIKLN